MRKSFVLFITLLIPAYLLAQSGKVYDNLSMTSKVLKGELMFSFSFQKLFTSGKTICPTTIIF
ncbi:MAG: hypothetical protein AB2L24_26350 [Mangrovibacterium sp.]